MKVFCHGRVPFVKTCRSRLVILRWNSGEGKQLILIAEEGGTPKKHGGKSVTRSEEQPLPWRRRRRHKRRRYREVRSKRQICCFAGDSDAGLAEDVRDLGFAEA